MSIKDRTSYALQPESPASSTKTLVSFDKFLTDQGQVHGSRMKDEPRLPNLEMTVHRGASTLKSATASVQNDEVARMRKLKRKLFLEAVAQSAE